MSRLKADNIGQTFCKLSPITLIKKKSSFIDTSMSGLIRLSLWKTVIDQRLL